MKKSSGLLQSLFTVTGNMFANGISALAIILLSRSLGPEKFGLFTVGFSLTLLLNKVNDLGFSQSLLKYIPKIGNPKVSHALFVYTTQKKITISLVILVLGCIATPQLSKLLSISDPTILYIAFIGNCVTTLYDHLQAMLQSLHRFTQSVLTALVQSGSKLVIAATLAVTVPSNVVLSFLSYSLIPVITLLPFIKKFKPTKQNITAEKNALLSMAKHSAIGFVALGITENIDVLFIQTFRSEYETGLFGGVSRIALLFSLSAYSLSTVLNPRVAKYQQKSDAISYIKKATLLCLGIVGMAFATLLLTNPLIRFSIGSDYLPAAPLLSILLVASFITLFTTPFVALFFSLKEAEWYFSASGMLQLVGTLLGNFIFVPIYGSEASAWTRVGVKVMTLVFTVAMLFYYFRRAHSPNSFLKSNKPKVQ